MKVTRSGKILAASLLLLRMILCESWRSHNSFAASRRTNAQLSFIECLIVKSRKLNLNSDHFALSVLESSNNDISRKSIKSLQKQLRSITPILPRYDESFSSNSHLRLYSSNSRNKISSLNDNTILTISYKSNENKSSFIINGSFFDDDLKEYSEVNVERSYKDFEKLQKDIVNRIGWKIPLLPPESTVINKIDGNLILEQYLSLLLETEVKDETIQLKELNKFLEIKPKSSSITSASEDENEDIKTYKAELVTDDEFDEDSQDRSSKKEEDKNMNSAKAGALAGLLLGGIPGALVGGLVGGAAASRDDTVGDVARTAGKVTSIAAKRLDDLNKRYRITDTAAESIKKGFQKFKKSIDELDEDLSPEDKPFPDPNDDKK